MSSKSPARGKRGFEDLRFYQESLVLLKEAYALADSLPNQERYNMTDQVRRASLSIVLNIAEGYGRYHFADRMRFFYIARGSLDETLSIFIAAQQVGYCNSVRVTEIRTLVHEIQRGLNGYVAYIKKQRQGAEVFGQTAFREEDIIYTVSHVDPSEDGDLHD